MIKFAIRNRWTGAVQFEAEIDVDQDAGVGIKVGLAVKWARDNSAVLRGADLRGAYCALTGIAVPEPEAA